MRTFAPVKNILSLLEKYFFSMSFMAMGLLLFLGAIGIATFIESLHGVQAAKIMVYNAFWFEILLWYLSLSLIANIVKYRMWVPEKIAMFSFHISFLVILIGAFVTRNFGKEGIMVVPEGQKVDYMYSSEPGFLIHATDLQTGEKNDFSEIKYLSEITPRSNQFNYKFKHSGRDVEVKFVNFKAKREWKIEQSVAIKSSGIELLSNGRNSFKIFENESVQMGSLIVSYNKKAKEGVVIKKQGDNLFIKSSQEMSVIKMSELTVEEQKTGIQDSSKINRIQLNKWHPLTTRTLYRIGNEQFVFNRLMKNSRRALLPTGNLKEGLDYLTVELSFGGKKKEILLEGGMGNIPKPERVQIGESVFQLEYGALIRPIPFAIFCKDFQLDYYPGSQAPSSFASEIRVIDTNNEKTFDKRIFMNHFMDYEGFRFFQSSYKLDDPNTPENEEATVLQVNQDHWGSFITYVGYCLMSVAMLLSLFAPVGRFRLLNKKLSGLKEKRNALLNKSVTLVFVLIGFGSFGQMDKHNDNLSDFSNHYQTINEQHSKKVERILVQEIKYNHSARKFSPTGRIIPFHTIADRLIRKIHRSTSFEDLNGVQFILSLHLYPQYWSKQPVLYIPSAVREKLKLNKHGSFEDLTGKDGYFKWYKDYNIAHQKLESKRNEFEKKLIKLNEKYEVLRGVFSWDYFQIAPLYKNKNNQWHQPKRIYNSAYNFIDIDSLFLIQTINAIPQPYDAEDSIFIESTFESIYAFQSANKSFLDQITFPGIQLSAFKKDYETAKKKLENYGAFLSVYLPSEDVKTALQQLNYLLIELERACESEDYSKANELVDELISQQRAIGKDVVPSESKVSMEIFYNKIEIFKNTAYMYVLFGFLSLVVFFIQLFYSGNSKFTSILKWTKWISFGFIGLFFIAHGIGIGIRWYLSGHAPWSNGYEALVFIAWITMIAGIAFSRKNAAVLPATAILAFFMLFVTELNLMDPEITPLVPVLQSYWLMVHVAIITGSYGFLGLGAILGLINIILFIFKTNKNKELMKINIGELTYISEMTITIGLFMLTIGTFLGGIWANESWGRYWGWDPKETWALVSILVYAILLHLRFIPKLNNKLVFNIFSFWAFSAILFTFFGVNFMLVGLHSYAQGDGLGELPNWILYTIYIFYFLSELAAVQHSRTKANYQIDWKKTGIGLAIKLCVVLGVFGIIYGIFNESIETSEPLSEFIFSSVKIVEYLMLVLLCILGTYFVLIPYRMGLIFRK